MHIYALADLHLSLAAGKPMDIFGGNWDGHHEKIRKNWQKVVTRGDITVIPGDVSWAMTLDEALEDLKFLNSLNGRKLVGKGNHDYFWPTKTRFDAFLMEHGLDTISLLYNNAYEAGELIICGTRGWVLDPESRAPENSGEADHKKILLREANRLKMSLECGKNIAAGRELAAFLHYPPVLGEIVSAEILETLAEYGVKRCWFGHVHSPSAKRSFRREGIEFTLCSSNLVDFTPVLVQ